MIPDDKNLKKWLANLQYVGLDFRLLRKRLCTGYKFEIEVYGNHSGLIGIGQSDKSLADAIECGAYKMNIDWGSVENKRQDEEWLSICHL